MPSFYEVEVFIVGGVGVEAGEVLVLESDLGVDEGGFDGDEAGLTPLEGGELVDEGLLGVVAWLVASAGFGEVFFEGGLVFDEEDDVGGGGEAVFDGVCAGFGAAFGGLGSFGFGAVEAGLFGGGEFVGHGVPFWVLR